MNHFPAEHAQLRSASRIESIAALKSELDADWEDKGQEKQEPAPLVQAKKNKSAGASLSLRGLQKSFGGRRVLKAIDLQVKAGEFVAVIGRSGCGKSTLLRLVAGLETADTGNIDFNPHAQAITCASCVNSVPNSRPDTRVMFQDSRLLPWKSVLDNVSLGLKQGSDAAKRALAQVDLAERADEWPSVLSGGQRQRVALARALVHEPALLLLDEPLGALDALTRIEMQNLIESLWQQRGFTALLVTHDVQEAIALADRVILIEDGQITLDEQVSLPRPRARGNPAFAALEEKILDRVLKRPAQSLDAPLGDLSLLKTVSQVHWAV
ncbi:ATP-binding cassette domain-containing protein [Undibacterium terreum]|uniref:Aliphatic sulfonates import ATP-binding protein SsuB 1 n=1 Tax=Undibacterium terreum TaxID=1224302 RepID=A0A916V0G7_9BURK|nr:ATP-binding cassette domain-containing protein [Undibacterium terreum]GGC97494.1 aliphatic sulfonates import ATP-binding protein SsuB 1 [Undibacterium terreum]